MRCWQDLLEHAIVLWPKTNFVAILSLRFWITSYSMSPNATVMHMYAEIQLGLNGGRMRELKRYVRDEYFASFFQTIIY